MTNEKKCRDCKYFDPNEGGNNGKCYRYPPQTSVTLLPNGVGIDGVPKLKTVELNAYPTPAADQWCGEWKDGKDNN